MTAKQTLYVQAMHGGIVLSAIIAVTVLGAMGELDGQSVVAVLGAALGFAGAAASSSGAIGQAVNGKAVIPDEAMRSREATLRTALVASAGSEPHVMVATEPEPELETV